MKFLLKLNEISNYKYDYLRIKTLDIDQDNMSVDIAFIIPYEIYQNNFKDEDKEIIIEISKQLLPSSFDINVHFSKIMLCDELVIKCVRDFFNKKLLALLPEIDITNLEIVIKNNNKVYVKIPVKSHIHSYCIKTNVDKSLKSYLDSCYNADNHITFFDAGEFDVSEIIKQDIQEHYMRSNHINTSFHQKLQGKEMSTRARFISDIPNKENQTALVCGTVSDFKRMISKTKGRIFYTFKLNDTTGEISCIAFSRSTKKGALDCVEDGQNLIVEGILIEDTYSKGYKLKADNISYCKIDFEELEQRQRNLIMAQKKKTKVKIGELNSNYINNIFDLITPTHSFFLGKTFVVFDTETTGVNPNKDQIIEIGAVRIVNGVISDYFSTLVDPKIPIPEGASQVNNIYDNDVVDSPYIEDVLDDFLKYCNGSPVVGHNAPFDVGFIKNACFKLGLSFDNKVYDTLALARKAKPNQRAHNLGAMCNTYGIKLENAHRAYFDAEATAQLFIKLVEDLDLKD